MKIAHEKLIKLRQLERQTLSDILTHLQVIQDKKYFLKLGYSSLFKYCTKELGYSESAAYRRIKALKLCTHNPGVKEKIKSGSLNLTQVADAQKVFEAAKCRDKNVQNSLLTRIQNESSTTSENTLRSHFNLPPKSKRIELCVSDDTRDKWSELKSRMAHLGLNEEDLFKRLIEDKLQDLKKITKTNKSTRASKNQRHVSAANRKLVLQRAQHICEYPGCHSTYALEIDHIRPISQGGQSEFENLRLLCRAHNQWRTL